jgi:uncharacterized protein involved in exopolysaccharide biosynthesis
VIQSESLFREQGDAVTLATLVRIVGRRWMVVIGCSVVGALGAAIAALVATSLYTAQVVVTEVADDSLGASASMFGQLGGLASLAGVNLSGSQSGKESKALLKSYRLVDEFIRRKDILPQIYPEVAAGNISRSQWFGVRRFRSNVLSIREDSRTGLITVSIKWSDPKIAAQWANDFVGLANELLRVRSIEESTRNIAYLNKQIVATDIVELRSVMYRLIESETKKLMLANARVDHAFTVVDPAVPPELRTSPRRTIMVIFGFVSGLAAGVFLAVAFHFVVHRRPALTT